MSLKYFFTKLKKLMIMSFFPVSVLGIEVCQSRSRRQSRDRDRSRSWSRKNFWSRTSRLLLTALKSGNRKKKVFLDVSVKILLKKPSFMN